MRERRFKGSPTLADGAAVDANVMCAFTESLIRKTDTRERAVVQRLEISHGFAIDHTGQIKHQWFETCGANVFGEWFIQGLKGGKIVEVRASLDKQHKKKLQQDCGMPTKRAEMMYVAVANVTALKYIVTNDIDFWEPKAKRQGNHEMHEQIKLKRSGAVSKYLKSMKIRVGTPAMALTELWNVSAAKPQDHEPTEDRTNGEDDSTGNSAEYGA